MREISDIPEVNPGPYMGEDGYYFDLKGKGYGPYCTEDEAEDEFEIALYDMLDPGQWS